MTKDPCLAVNLLLYKVIVTGNAFIKLSQTVAPRCFCLWILLPLIRECPGNALFAGSVMSGCPSYDEWEPAMYQSSTSYETTEVMKRRTLPLTRQRLKHWCFACCPIARLTYLRPTSGDVNRYSHRMSDCLPSLHGTGTSETKMESFVLGVLVPVRLLVGAHCNVKHSSLSSLMTWTLHPGHCFTWWFDQRKGTLYAL